MLLWAYACDVDGNVAIDIPAAYASANGNAATMEFINPVSRYYLLAAVLNVDADGNSFTSLSSTKFTDCSEDVASHWKVVDLMSEGVFSGNMTVRMDVFHTVGRLKFSISKTSELMRLLVTDVSVCSVSAPSEGVLMSRLTPDQIRVGGKGLSQWWFDGCSPATVEYSETILQDVEITEVASGSTILFENPYGWTDLSVFEADGFSLNPAESDPDCTGYYLVVDYRYSFMPEISLEDESELVTAVRKYVPLSPVCRGNEYNIKIAVNQSDIIVAGSTEVSEEVNGAW